MATHFPHLEILVGVADIAGLAKVNGSAVVTNWRSRFPTFPEARVHGSQPKFELEEVLDWLRHDGPRGRSMPDPDPMWRWQRLVEAFGAAHSTAEARAQAAALVAVRTLLGGDDTWREVVSASEPRAALQRAARRAAKAAGSWSEVLGAQLAERLDVDPGTAVHLGQLAEALDAVLVDGRAEPSEVLAAVLELEAKERRRSPHRTRPVLARLMASMAAVDGTDTVFDPAAGEGDVLDECARRTEGRAVLHGQEYDAGATFIAAVRSLVRGARTALAAPGHDSLRDDQFDTERFSVVVVDPPLGGEYPLSAWIRHGVAHLRPDGRLVMALPLAELAPVAAARRQPDKKLQAYLSSLFDGRSSDGLHLDGVMVVARRVRTDIVGPVALVALSGPARPRPHGDVPVAWVGSRAEVEGVVGALDDAMRAHGARGLLELESSDTAPPDVIVRRSGPERLFATLTDLVDPSDGVSSSRAASERVADDDESAVVRASAPPRTSLRMSQNSQRALLADSLTARSMRRSPSAHSDVPPDMMRFAERRSDVRFDDEVPELEDRIFVEPADTAAVRRALDELRRVLTDARRGTVHLDDAAISRLDGVAAMLHDAVAAIERDRLRR